MTICTFQRQIFFGEVVNSNLHPNQYGHIAQDCWRALPNHFSRGSLDAFVVMPNHVHGVLLIPDVGARHAVSLPPERFGRPIAGSIATVVRSYKSAVTRRIGQARDISVAPVWQRNYYEHIIRDDDELNHVRQYIIDNPSKWGKDENNPSNLS